MYIYIYIYIYQALVNSFTFSLSQTVCGSVISTEVYTRVGWTDGPFFIHAMRQSTSVSILNYFIHLTSCHALFSIVNIYIMSRPCIRSSAALFMLRTGTKRQAYEYISIRPKWEYRLVPEFWSPGRRPTGQRAEPGSAREVNGRNTRRRTPAAKNGELTNTSVVSTPFWFWSVAASSERERSEYLCGHRTVNDELGAAGPAGPVIGDPRGALFAVANDLSTRLFRCLHAESGTQKIHRCVGEEGVGIPKRGARRQDTHSIWRIFGCKSSIRCLAVVFWRRLSCIEIKRLLQSSKSKWMLEYVLTSFSRFLIVAVRTTNIRTENNQPKSTPITAVWLLFAYHAFGSDCYKYQHFVHLSWSSQNYIRAYFGLFGCA